LNIASERIKEMGGKYRIPTLLKELDKQTREKKLWLTPCIAHCD
jgi:hypothetical protein